MTVKINFPEKIYALQQQASKKEERTDSSGLEKCIRGILENKLLLSILERTLLFY